MEKYRSFFLLNGLSKEEKAKIIAFLEKPKYFSKGEIIYSKNNFSNAIGYIIEGKANAFTNNNGIVMKRFVSGMSFGVAALFGSEKSYVSTLRAESDCIIQFVDEETLSEIFSLFPKTALNYIAFLSDKVRFLNKKLGIISCQSTEEKVLSYLIDSANERGEVPIPDNVSLLSKSLSIGRTSFYRSIEALEKKGSISREKNIIRVINYEENC